MERKMDWDLLLWEYDEEIDLKKIPAYFLEGAHEKPLHPPLWIREWVDECVTHAMFYAREKLSFPYCKGWNSRLHYGHLYLAPCAVTDEEEIKKREPLFRERIRPFIEDFGGVWDGYKAEMIGYYEKLETVDLARLDNVDLVNHWKEIFRIDRRMWEIHFLMMCACYCPYILFEDMVRDLVGIDDSNPLFHKLMRGFDNEIFRCDRQLWQLAQRASELGLADVFLGNKATEVVPRLKEMDAGRKWLAELDQFLKVYGMRLPIIHMISLPTWAEEPSPAILTIQNFLRKGGGFKLDEERERLAREREEAEKEVLAKVPSEHREWFEKLLHCAQFTSSFSEEHLFWLEDHIQSLIRYCALEFGRRYVAAGAIDEVDDIFYFSDHEVAKYGYSPDRFDLRPLLRAHKREHEENIQAVRPPVISKLPIEEAFGYAIASKDPVVLKLVAGTLPVPKPELKADLYGTCGSPGVVEGTARVIFSDEQLGEVQPGEILVAPCTYVAWTGIFPLITGAVIDRGGSLAHACICSREYGIPCLTNTFEASTKIKTGQRIRVDADMGAIYILEE